MIKLFDVGSDDKEVAIHACESEIKSNSYIRTNFNYVYGKAKKMRINGVDNRVGYKCYIAQKVPMSADFAIPTDLKHYYWN